MAQAAGDHVSDRILDLYLDDTPIRSELRERPIDVGPGDTVFFGLLTPMLFLAQPWARRGRTAGGSQVPADPGVPLDRDAHS